MGAFFVKAEIIAVGTELLLGQISNTNGQFLARTLADIGIDTYYQTVVGDNQKRLESVLKLAQTRSDLIITIGGLGPTEDDLTKQTVAKHLGKQLVPDKKALARLQGFYTQSQRPLTPNNQIQAYYVADATVLDNDHGLAVGSASTVDGVSYILLPGPPSEFKPMVTHKLRPLLIAMTHHDEFLLSRVLRFYGIGESLLATELDDLIVSQTNPTLATYAKDHEVTLRLTAKAPQKAEAVKLLNDLEAKVQARVGDYFYGYGDDNSLQKVVVNALIAQKTTLTAAESLTGGLFQSMIAEVPGASEVFAGGFVTYAMAQKAKMLAIPLKDLEKNGVVSQQTAAAMALQSKQRLGADIGIGFTGVAGPDKLEDQQAGTVYIGLAFKDQPVDVKLFHFPRQRNDVRTNAAMAGFFMIFQALQAERH
ncbi:competence damage-inducible protein A [Agrilactobacillus composti DSM 18527 = JCM 14202]|uniref:Putative competence-damage inducible protein n=1 Tax=Agrilactobacillus composti DSM 18527 = JCM 14202 TaxID=1423734 RepID=X0QR30_9LACO|nr:competence damage-inducible protein A [Agrilactobacillus composti DSM 18527 = JCM 14202]GAF41065.1 competence/damage-inducible protein CinA [Agrilactobacillus composti DSM 18527 = JCM 14202]